MRQHRTGATRLDGARRQAGEELHLEQGRPGRLGVGVEKEMFCSFAVFIKTPGCSCVTIWARAGSKKCWICVSIYLPRESICRSTRIDKIINTVH